MISTNSVRTSDGRTLRFVDGGDPAGWPLILHHGTPTSGDLYPPHVQFASDHGLRLIGYDRPGYGGSSRLRGRRVVSAGDDVRTIADHLGLAKFSVWGHSGGGPHALGCAAALPDRVASVAASGSIAPYEAKGLDWLAGMGDGNLREFRAVLEGPEALERYLQPELNAMRSDSEEISPELLTLLSPEDFELLKGPLGAHHKAATRRAILRSADGWIDDDLAFLWDWGFDLKSVNTPSSIWHGKLDRFVPYAHGVWLSQHIPRSEFHGFEDETHLTLVDRRFGEIALWLRDHAPSQ